MKGSSARRAFTLVELLVVIGIISMLIGMLMVAVLAALAQAENVQCRRNLTNHAQAVALFAMAKERLPGYATTVAVDSGGGTTQTVDVGWVPQLFSYLDMDARYRSLVEGRIIDGKPAYLAHLKVFTCPADPPDLDASFWTQSGCGGPPPSPAPTIPYPLSYAVNAGRPDQTVGPPDDARFAAFHDHRQGVPRVSVSLSDVTDGITNTIAITENTDLANWTSVSETHQGVVWFDTPSILANRDALAVFDCDGDGLADNLDYAHARPYSFHSEGFNVAYLDGHVEFFFIDPADPVGAYEMYKARMTPANAD